MRERDVKTRARSQVVVVDATFAVAMMQVFYELGLICALHILAPVAAMLPRHVAPACFPLIKDPFNDVLSYCFGRALQSHCEEMRRGETEGSLRHNGLITLRRLSLAWFNNHCNTFCFPLVEKHRKCSSGY